MSRNKTKEELDQHKIRAIKAMENYIDELIASNNVKINGKADKLSYWLEDYSKFLAFEKNFTSTSLKRYKRGEVIKVHLGYNIGSEEGGLHYAVVLDNDNSINNPVITILPLTSVKPNKDLGRLKRGELFLGSELFKSLDAKLSNSFKSATLKIEELNVAIDEAEHIKSIKDTSSYTEVINGLNAMKLDIQRDMNCLNEMNNELQNMKSGSIALANQITTISKIRIKNPKTTDDILSGIKLSNSNLDEIDKLIIKLFTKKN